MDVVDRAPRHDGIDQAVTSAIGKVSVVEAERAPCPVVVVEVHIEGDGFSGKPASLGRVLAPKTHHHGGDGGGAVEVCQRRYGAWPYAPNSSDR